MNSTAHYAIKNMISAYLTRQRWHEYNQLESNTNLNYSNMDTLTLNEVQELKERFLTELKRPFTERLSAKVEMNDEGLVESAQINTQEILTDQMIDDLQDISAEYDLRIQIKRSGAGMKISLNLKKD